MKERVLEDFGDGAAFSVADGAVVYFADGGDFGGGAGKEGLIGAIEFIAGDAFFADFISGVVCQGDNGFAGDAFQRGGQVGGEDFPAPDDEDILARPFGDQSVDIQQQGFIISVFGDFGLGHHGVEIVSARFGAAHADIDMMAGEGGGFDADAVFNGVLAEIGAPGPGGDDKVDGIVGGGDSEFSGAIEGEGTDIAGAEFVFADDCALGGGDLFGGGGQGHPDDAGGVHQPLGVVGQAKNGGAIGGVIGAHAFKDAGSIMEPVREDVDFGVPPGDKRAVHPN